MKKLLTLPLLTLLVGCVSYYYPQTALKDGVYYAEDDPTYVVSSGAYAGFAYYPWSSLDYFYLGYNPYPRYGFYYGHGGHGGYSFAVSYGYSPWHYPYSDYGYYSPWYTSYHRHPYHPGWQPYYGYCPRYDGCLNRRSDHRDGRGNDRYAGNDHNDRRGRDGKRADSDELPPDNRDENTETRNYGGTRVGRYVSTPPSGYSGNQGMLIRSRQDAKPGITRTEPGKYAPVQQVSAEASGSTSTRRASNSRTTADGVRYRSDTKQGKTRTGPIVSSPSSNGIVIVAEPVRPAGASSGSRNPGSTARPGTASTKSNKSSSGNVSRPPAASRPSTSSRSNGRSRSSHSSSGHRNSTSVKSSNREKHR